MSRSESRLEVRTNGAPEPVGPYSQAVVYGGLVYASGQIPIDPRSGQIIKGEIEAQTEQVIANLPAVLEAAGSHLEKVIRTTVYLTDLSLFPRVNAIYAEHFRGSPAPARATVEVTALPLGSAVEIDAIAISETASI
ncbi:Rid family detoxifying hydrolase [Myxococcota bacterium]|nr:Rid family detoxifying hydrolase [Myxococcota bacterium]